MTAVDPGYAALTLRLPWFSARVRARSVAVGGALLGFALLCSVVALAFGEYPLPLAEVSAALRGGGEEFSRLVVLEWRAPIALAAVLFGAVLGVGGALFQSLTRNPLGSPDVIGFDAGSYTAVVVTILVLGNQGYWTQAGASLAGGVATAAVVYALSWRRGIQGFRMIIVGIAVTAILGSVNSYLISRAELDDAMVVGFWGAGSVGRVTWTSMLPAGLLVLLVLAASLCLAPALRRLELGDDTALTQGTNVHTVRALAIVLGVSSTAIVTAAAGPIGFIALVAPQIARRLTRSAGLSLLGAAATGAALLTLAHLVSVVLETYYRSVPVGLITVSVGGLYLMWLLVRESRARAVRA